MAIKENRRTGGRSARVQESIHTAVRALLDERDRADLTVPQIAARAGVTPSTIYRRWGDLSALLADVALERMLPSEPQDTGTLAGDLHAWVEQYLDEMSSELGRTLIRDVVSDLAGDYPGQCADLVRCQLQLILDRAAQRGEAAPSADQLVDAVVAPMIYRILFAPQAPSAGQVRTWVDGALSVSIPLK